MSEDPEKTLVLFVAAEPRGSSPIRLGSEFRDIIGEIERKGGDGGLEFRTLWAARPIDVTRAMSDYEPVIVHFSGHGTPDGGFLLESIDGSSKTIDRKAMRAIFDTYRKQVKAVVLNSCYSDELAEEIAKSVDVVIGMREEIGIKAAVRFSVGFYRGIAAKKNLQKCFQMARTEMIVDEIAAEMIPDSDLPTLFTRPGVEAYDVFASETATLEGGRQPTNPDVSTQRVQGSPAIRAEHGINIAIGDGATDRKGPRLAELALGGIGGAAAERCLEVMIRSHRGSDRQGESPGDDSRPRDDGGVQRDDSGQLTALHGVPLRQYPQAEPWQLATELGNGHSVLVGTEAHTAWRQNAIFQDLGATDPILLSRIETGDPGQTRVIVLAPGSEKVSAGYPIGRFLDAWQGSRFFMVATQEPPLTEFQFSGANGWRGHAGAKDSLNEAIWDGVQDVASGALGESFLSHLETGATGAGGAQSLPYPSPHDPHQLDAFTEGSPEISTSAYPVDAAGADADEDPSDTSFGDLAEDGWPGVD